MPILTEQKKAWQELSKLDRHEDIEIKSLMHNLQDGDVVGKDIPHPTDKNRSYLKDLNDRITAYL